MRAAGDVSFWGTYVLVSYFLTGEQRPYQRRRGIFGRVPLRQRFSWKDRYFGAWEVAARYSHLDLNDRDIRGGNLSNFTLALNWYVLPNVRLMGNWVRAHLNGVGDSNIFQMRFQIDY